MFCCGEVTTGRWTMILELELGLDRGASVVELFVGATFLVRPTTWFLLCKSVDEKFEFLELLVVGLLVLSVVVATLAKAGGVTAPEATSCLSWSALMEARMEVSTTFS